MLSQWYVYQGGHQNGPLTHDEMIHFIEAGCIKPADLAWTKGMDEWLRIDQIGNFYSLILNQKPLGRPAKDDHVSPSAEYGAERASALTNRCIIRSNPAVLIILLAALLFAVIGGAMFAYQIIDYQQENVAERWEVASVIGFNHRVEENLNRTNPKSDIAVIFSDKTGLWLTDHCNFLSAITQPQNAARFSRVVTLKLLKSEEGLRGDK